MVHSVEIEVALLWSIKKETFMKNVSTVLFSESNQTVIPSYEYYFGIRQKDGDVAIFFEDDTELENSKIKEMTLTIPSANFKADLSKKADVPEDHHFYGRRATVALKSEDILNPEKNFFVDDIFTLEFRGIVECNKEPNTESLSQTLWNAEDKDFTFIIGKQEIKAHKFILRQYSSVFSEMFNSNVNQIEINGFKYATVNYALCVCYDKRLLGIPVGALLGCIHFAEVYDMPIIKERISNELADKITAKNVCEIANKSVEYNVRTLKGYCINFILKCKRDGKQYDNALNLNIEIVHDLYKSSLFRTETS